LPWRWIIPAGLLTVLSVAVVVLGLLSAGGTTAGEDPTPTVPTTYATAAPPSSGDNEDQRPGATPEGVPALPATKDPDVYGQAVADVVYSRDWHRSPDDYRAALHAGLDPEYVLASEAREAIISTLDARIPEPWLWERMVGAKQTNTFTPQATWEPEIASDPRALEQWPQGVAVRNVQGVQTLRYLNERGEFQTDHVSVTVTVFMVCPPARDHCTLLGVPREVAR
jgi:hypothetical protein